MRNNVQIKICCVVFAMLAIASPAQAVDYDVTVDVSDVVLADLTILESIFDNATDGAEINGSVRRLVNGVLGEFELLLDGKISADGLLTLDDGTIIALIDGDVLSARAKRKLGIVITGCRLLVPPGNTVKRIIPHCKTVCGRFYRVNQPPICNIVPPRKFMKKL